MKKIAFITFLIIVAIFIGGVVLVLVLDNSDLRPGGNYVTDYISPHSRYAVRTLYDHNDNPIDIVIVDAKSGVSVAVIEQDAYTYEISEVSSTLTFTLKDNEGVVMEVYNFDTKKGEWIK